MSTLLPQQEFAQRILIHCDQSLLHTSRVHPIPSLHTTSCQVWTLRDDELSFGISGSKKRKYASLLPFLSAQGIPLVGLVGGDRSNHIIGMIQLLREKRIPFHLYLKENPHAPISGNRFLLDLLALPDEITWIQPTDWHQVHKEVGSLLHARHPNAYLIPEGGSCPPALAGACTLALAVVQSEQDLGITFDHILVDSGTGLTASALACGLATLAHTGQVAVVLTAGKDTFFEQQVQTIIGWGQDQGFWETCTPKLSLHQPVTAKSFGAVNQTILQSVRSLAQTEGILTDPIYTAKLFLTAQHLIQSTPLTGNCLIIHTGGGTGLFGFADRLSPR